MRSAGVLPGETDSCVPAARTGVPRVPSLTPSAVESSPLSSNSRPAAAPRSRLPAQPVELLAAHPPPLCASCAPREGTPLLSPQVKSAPAPSPPWRCEFQQQTQASRCRLCHFAKGGREKEQNKGRGPMNKSRSPEEKESKKKKKKGNQSFPLSESHHKRWTVKIQ